MQWASSSLITKKRNAKKPYTRPRKSEGDRRLKLRNRTLKFGTWNVQGCRNKMREIVREINVMNMDLVVLTETKKKGTGIETLGNYVYLFSGVKKYERAKKGVSILINKKRKDSIKNWEYIDGRILRLYMNIWGYKLTIIGICAPNEDNGATVKDEFFANLNEEIVKSDSGRQLILMGDMNGKTGRKTGDTIVGNFGEDRVNDNGERLIELCTQTSLKIWNVFFNHKDINKYTWEQHTKNLKTIIDYIITKQDLKGKIQDVRAYRGPNCGTDNKLLVAKILFSCMYTTKDKYEEKKENTVTEVNKKGKYNVESLQNESTKFLYQQRLNNKLSRNEFTDTEEMYNYLTICIHEAAMEALGEKEVNKGRKTIFLGCRNGKERQNKKLFLK